MARRPLPPEAGLAAAANRNKGPKRKTAEEKQMVRDKLAAGMTATAIVEETGFSMGTILKIKKEMSPATAPLTRMAEVESNAGHSPLHWAIYDIGFAIINGMTPDPAEVEKAKEGFAAFQAKHLRDLSRAV